MNSSGSFAAPILVVSLFAAVLPRVSIAQAASHPAPTAWRLPLRGAAEYERTCDAKSGVADTMAAARQVEAKDKVPDGLLPHLVPTPWLCQGELTADQRAVADEPRDLRDVLRALAFDLRLDGDVKLRFRRIVPFGDLVVTGKAAPAGTDGAQTFTFAVATEDPEVRPGEGKAALGRFIRPLCKHDAVGTVTIERTFDAAQGVVTKFRGEVSLAYEEKKGSCRRLLVSDAWTLKAVHQNQDADFRGDVRKAIESGAGWLQREFKDLGRKHLQDQADGERTYGSGRIALGLLTLLHAEVPHDDPVVVAAFDELRRRELVDSYSLGVALMALAEWYTAPGEADLLRSGQLAAPRERKLSEADKKLAGEWLAKLLQNIDTRSKPGYRMAFNYTAGARFDNSVNQYGLLGLYAASLCGLEISPTTWRATAAYQLDVAVPHEGRTLPLELTTYKELAAQAAAAGDAATRTRSAPVQVPTRGYAYHTPDRPAYGSMTAAGVGSLVISRFGLLRSGQNKADVMPKIDAGIQSGFAWLGAEFCVRNNPGYIDRADDNFYYYLYGLERTCELHGVALIHGRDWYYEGGLQILSRQQKNGAFASEHPRGLLFDATCFAVLFLKKAALPPVTGG
ncbi:MAG: hypothetical protein JNK15_10890 [Planctomycetes bacterium]|nr:hypothetical protein [Planctomycetota bacterium]